jgi:hypothetical protein
MARSCILCPVMKCLKKSAYVIDENHRSTEYIGPKKCGHSDEDSSLYLCFVCERSRQARARGHAVRKAAKGKMVSKP